MRKVAIVGAGQAGLPLAMGLLNRHYEVTVVSDRTPEEIRCGHVLSSQCMFGSALQLERDLDLNHWEHDYPQVEGMSFALASPQTAGEKLIDFGARLEQPAQSVDYRLKFPAWLELIQTKGATVLIKRADISLLETLAAQHDLVIIAAGKSDIARLMQRDSSRSPFETPKRALSLAYVHGLDEQHDYPRITFNTVPGVGEYITIPAMTLTGPCHILFFEGIPGGSFDAWQSMSNPHEHLALTKRLLQTWLPWEADRARNAELTDQHGTLTGTFAPVVREPVLTLPSGRAVFGLGDAVVLNDPITGQGSSNAMKACRIYLDAILAHGDKAFTRPWMEQTFEKFWSYSQWVVRWTNSLLTPPPRHIEALLGAAMHVPAIASEIVNGFDHPPRLFPWWTDESACEAFISHRAGAEKA